MSGNENGFGGKHKLNKILLLCNRTPLVSGFPACEILGAWAAPQSQSPYTPESLPREAFYHIKRRKEVEGWAEAAT
jgi:hypothetical protein